MWTPLGDLDVCESGDVGGVELLEFDGGAPAQGAVASLPVVEDLQVLKDRVGELERVVHRWRSRSSSCIRDHNASTIALMLLICEPVARQRDLLVLRCWLGMVDRAGVKVEWPERRVDDDLDPGEGRRRMKQRRGSLGHCSGITSGGLVWSVARGRPALSRCSDQVRRHDG
jgi:hypothetical protein